MWGYVVGRDCPLPSPAEAMPVADSLVGDSVLGDSVLGDSVLGDSVLGDAVLADSTLLESVRGPFGESSAGSFGESLREAARESAAGMLGESPAESPAESVAESAAGLPGRANVRQGRVPGRWELPARRLVDLAVATVALILLAAPMLMVAVTIRLASQGPALFRQRRIGQGGVPFTMYKFRTMRVGCSDEAHRELIARELRGEDTSADGSWKLHGDARLAPFGDWLRRTSIDELPQLFNVLRGQMALVGPRPCLDWEAEMFPARYAERFAVRPGVTGLWQVNGRSTMGTLDMLEFDVAYARDWSFWGDLKILARTVPSMLRDQGAR